MDRMATPIGPDRDQDRPWNTHKKHLYERTEKLVENKPPRSNQQEESFQFSTRYVNLIIVSTNHFRQRSENELIELGKKHEEYLKKSQYELQHIFPNKLFRWYHESNLVPHMVMVIGVPGVGKTTLMQKFVYDWGRKVLYQRFSFVFFFKFRELNRLDNISVETMILHQYPHLEEQLEDIFQDPEKLLFIFDGLDESFHEVNFTSHHLCSNPKQPKPCGQIVVSLVRKSLLKGCSVLMTSRPTRLTSIDHSVFQRKIEIIGFFPEERQMYFENFFSNPEMTEKAFSYVKQNETLYTFCYLPSYCWIICTVLSRSFQTTSSDQPVLLPKTVTQLFAIFIANILANHSLHKSDAQEILRSIGWMAEHGEFFSALVHYVDYSPVKLQKSLYNATSYSDGRGEMFLRFLFGLSDNSTRSILTGYLDPQAAQASINVITWVKNFIVDKQRQSITNKQHLLSIFFYMYESRNKALVLELLQSHRKLDFSGVHMSSLDCMVLAFILEICTNIEELNFSRCSLDIEGLDRLASVLHNLKNLRLDDNDLTDISCIQLASITRNNRSLNKLDLSDNRLSGPHLSNLMEALSSPDCRIEELRLLKKAKKKNQPHRLSSPNLEVPMLSIPGGDPLEIDLYGTPAVMSDAVHTRASDKQGTICSTAAPREAEEPEPSQQETSQQMGTEDVSGLSEPRSMESSTVAPVVSARLQAHRGRTRSSAKDEVDAIIVDGLQRLEDLCCKAGNYGITIP
ncbi:unnamed protein product [Ranitomeya imitator]|uniref:NACHT domain-containing protein n=1 Tax=Ranitomeya imitator TaxID=111125 RepID=A0ABN9KXP6_9NEOB|nr:unnamed protein product [Ranitomeya imitator]